MDEWHEFGETKGDTPSQGGIRVKGQGDVIIIISNFIHTVPFIYLNGAQSEVKTNKETNVSHI